jgi:hypothetical protein
MLKITIPATEFFDESIQEFVNTKPQELQLEHSLVSLSKWESKWCVPFLSKTDKTTEQTLDYIKCMTITQNVDPLVYQGLTQEIIDLVTAYIDLPMTATTFPNDKSRGTNREIVTAEIIYYWMIALTIPFECQKWHLNKLLTLVNVCNLKNQPKKKMGKKALLERNRSLNEARKAALGTNG